MLLCAALWCLALGGAVHRAEAQDDTNTRARALFERGVAMSADERWAEALAAFEESRALVERPSTLFNIATALQRLGRARDAIHVAENYLAISNARRDAEQRAAASMLIDVLRTTLATLTLDIVPAGAVVEVDGRIEAADTLGHLVITLDPGEHRLLLSANGYVTRRERISLAAAQRQSLRFELALPPPSPSFISVHSSVTAARIEIDDRDVGRGIVEHELAPGRHRVEVSADGYVALQRSVALAPGQHVRLDAALSTVPPTLLEEPWFWAIAGTLVVGAAVIVGTVLLQPEIYRGTTSQTVEALSW
jgi:tetratricopeptide (TPR) repeat protein